MPAKTNSPVFTLPPFTVSQVFTTYSETVDWGLRLLGVPRLWRLSQGEGIRVAVLDTGCALRHPDLKDAILKSKDFTKSKSGVADAVGHGTHVAGIIAARENSSGVIGVAPKASLLIGKVLGDDGSGTLDSLVKGYEWAIAEKADIVVTSLGCGVGNPALERAVKACDAAGIFMVAAAGNEGPTLDTVGYPAAYPEPFSVGAVDSKRKVAKFSSRGQRVDLVAPGVDILSTYPPRNLAKLSGSSQGAPFVAGVMALLLARRELFESRRPLTTRAEMLDALKAATVDLGAGPEHDPAQGWGMIDPVKLLQTDPVELRLAAADFSAAGKAKLESLFGQVPADGKYRIQTG